MRIIAVATEYSTTITNKLLFSNLLIPRDYPLTPFYPCTTQSPINSDLRR